MLAGLQHLKYRSVQNMEMWATEHYIPICLSLFPIAHLSVSCRRQQRPPLLERKVVVDMFNETCKVRVTKYWEVFAKPLLLWKSEQLIITTLCVRIIAFLILDVKRTRRVISLNVIMNLHVNCPLFLSHSFFKNQIFEKYSTIKFHENPFSGSWVGPKEDRDVHKRTDKHYKANSSFSQICERAY